MPERNPFEETLQAGRSNNIRRNFTDLVPDVSTRPADPLHPVFPGMGPGEGIIKPGKNRHGTEFFGWGHGAGEGSFWNVRADQPRQDSGVMLALANSPAINKMKYIYNQVDPFFPDVDPIDQQIGYNFDKNLWGGTLGFGGGYDMEDDAYNAYINWGTDW